MHLFDVHAHLTHPRLREREAEVLANARAAGVTSIISNGLNPEDNEAVRALAERSDLVRPAFGLYPVDAVLSEMEAMGVEYPREGPLVSGEEGVAWVAEHVDACDAVGEIGLDGYWVPEALWAKQEQHFIALVKIAMQADKPIIIHSRKRERRAFEILEELGTTRVNWHCFGGRVKLARRIAEAGHYLSIPANARRNQAFTRMLETLPRTQILLETDCPYLAPDRDHENEPKNVTVTARYTAELWGETLESVEEQLNENYRRLFPIR